MIFKNSRRRTDAILKTVFLAITQEPIARLQWNLLRETSFPRISAMEKITMFHRTYFFFS